MTAFLFTRNFDAEACEAVDRARHDDAALARAAEEARAAGFAAGQAAGHASGRAEAEADIAARSAAALDAAAPALETLLSEIGSHQAALEEQLRLFALSVCEKTFPALLDRLSARYVSDEIDKLCARVVSDNRLVVTLSPATLAAVGDDLRARAGETHGRHLDLRADPDLPDGAFRARWKDGFAANSLNTICASILHALRDLSARPDPTPRPQGRPDD